MRGVYDVSRINIPRTVMGVEWRMAAALGMFFGFAALMFREMVFLLAPVLIGLFLRGPGLRDPDFLKIVRRHSSQRDYYSPAGICRVNLRTPRPSGFSRLETP